MPLFKNIRQVQNYIAVSAATNDTNLPPQITAEEEYLIPLLGQPLFDGMQTEANTTPVNPSVLLNKCLRALAFLMYYKELPFIHTRITSTGLKNVTTEKEQTAYRYQYEDLLDRCEMEGRSALENIFSYLVANPETYAGWKASDVFKRLNKNLIVSGTDFAGYYHIHQPHRTFYALQPILQEVEDFFLKPAIGPLFFAELKDNANPSEDEKEVLLLLRKSLANLTIYKACTKLSVKVRTEGFTVLLAPAPDRNLNGENNAPANMTGQLRLDCERDGNNYLNQATAILNKKASVDIFKTYFESSFYKAPNLPTTNYNDNMNGIYAFG